MADTTPKTTTDTIMGILSAVSMLFPNGMQLILSAIQLAKVFKDSQEITLDELESRVNAQINQVPTFPK